MNWSKEIRVKDEKVPVAVVYDSLITEMTLIELQDLINELDRFMRCELDKDEEI